MTSAVLALNSMAGSPRVVRNTLSGRRLRRDENTTRRNGTWPNPGFHSSPYHAPPGRITIRLLRERMPTCRVPRRLAGDSRRGATRYGLRSSQGGANTMTNLLRVTLWGVVWLGGAALLAALWGAPDLLPGREERRPPDKGARTGPRRERRFLTARAKTRWAFEPIPRVDLPADPTGWSANPIDRFVRANQREHG